MNNEYLNLRYRIIEIIKRLYDNNMLSMDSLKNSIRNKIFFVYAKNYPDVQITKDTIRVVIQSKMSDMGISVSVPLDLLKGK